MTTFTTSPTATPSTASLVRRTRRSRAAAAAMWAVRLVLVAQFAVGGVLKLAGEPQMVAMFDQIAAGQGLRLLVGVCELAGAAGLLVPRLVRLAGLGLVALLVGAALTNVVTLQTSPALPLVLLALAGLVATRRGTRSAR